MGPAKLKTLAASRPDLTGILRLGRNELALVPGIGEKLAADIHRFLHSPALKTAEDEAERQLEQLHRLGGRMATILDADYPSLLREIYDPPPCLFIRGTLPPPDVPGISVVGTRKASTYGRSAASLLAGGLAARGVCIYSGLAYGIDTAAHRAAIEAGGTTVAVLATGVDTVYTDPNGKLWPRILERGALISEEWIGSETDAGKFPKRNRIISGISAGTLVVESALRGGSLNTASSALEQNREVFAVPGSIFSEGSRGTNRLIQEGQAKPVMAVEDVLQEFGPAFAPIG
nr:DNA-processing protein DprA [Chlorobium sp. N1]